MLFNDFQDLRLSRLGFGAMRLPLLDNGEIDRKQVAEMVDYAINHGINYFDTAFPYHSGMSEIVMGEILEKYPRESFNLASKYPGHQLADHYDPEEIFEEQLKKCRVEYFDFYLLHNVYEKSIETYKDPKWGIVDYFIKQKRLGRIKHLGFSTHARLDCLKEFLDLYGSEMEFCQIQLNYLDWTLQQAKEKYELITSYGLPVWVMEPLRGGKLANPSNENSKKIESIREGCNSIEMAFKFLQGKSNVKMILSGMSDINQMKDNIRYFEAPNFLNEEEESRLLEIAESMKDSVPCTSCRYCTEHCPMELNIPGLIALWNDFKYVKSFNVTMAVEALPEDKRPSACIACGNCMRVCPQNIEIPKEFSAFTEELNKMPSWAEICRQRAEAAKRSKNV